MANHTQETLSIKFQMDKEPIHGEILYQQGVECLIRPNGAKYEGQFSNGVQSGYGVYFFPPGDSLYRYKYEGGVYNGIFHGQGTLYQ